MHFSSEILVCQVRICRERVSLWECWTHTIVSRFSEEHLPEPCCCSTTWDRLVPGTRPLSWMVFSVGGVDLLFKNLYIYFKASIQFLLQWPQTKSCFFSLAFIYLAPTPALAWKKEKPPKGELLSDCSSSSAENWSPCPGKILLVSFSSVLHWTYAPSHFYPTDVSFSFQKWLFIRTFICIVLYWGKVTLC